MHKAKDFPDEKPTANIIDSVIWRGLNLERSQNPSREEVHVHDDYDAGIMIFTDKALSDRYSYINQTRLTDSFNKYKQTIV